MSEPADELTYPCPACGAPTTPTPDRPNLLVCAACQNESFVPEPEPPPQDEPEPDDLRADEMDPTRVRRLATERRSMNRTASYFIVATGVCVVAIGQLVWMTVQHLRAVGWTPRPIGYLLFIVLALWAGWYVGNRAAALRREAKMSALPEPTTPPDFSTLDDGSKHWKNLEDVR